MRISIEIEGSNAVEEAFSRLGSAIDPTMVLDEAGALLLNRIVQRFRQQVDENGQQWAPLAPRTVRERIKLGYPGTAPILYRSGQLLRSIQLAKTEDLARAIFTELPKAGLLQFGGETDEGAQVPARSFIGASQQDADLMYALVIKRITNAFEGP